MQPSASQCAGDDEPVSDGLVLFMGSRTLAFTLLFSLIRRFSRRRRGHGCCSRAARFRFSRLIPALLSLRASLLFP